MILGFIHIVSSVCHHFWWLNTNPLHGNSPLCDPYISGWVFRLFPPFDCRKSYCWAHLSIGFGVHTRFHFSWVCTCVWNSWVTWEVCAQPFEEVPHCFQSGCTTPSPHQGYEGSNFPVISLSILIFLFIFYYASPSGHEVASLRGFDFTALIINEVEYLFMFLLASYRFLTEIE